MGSVCDACYAIKKRNKIFDALSIVIWGTKLRLKLANQVFRELTFKIFEPLITIVKKNQLVRKDNRSASRSQSASRKDGAPQEAMSVAGCRIYLQ